VTLFIRTDGLNVNLAPGKVDLALSLVGYDEEVLAAMNYVFGNTLICDDADTNLARGKVLCSSDLFHGGLEGGNLIKGNDSHSLAQGCNCSGDLRRWSSLQCGCRQRRDRHTAASERQAEKLSNQTLDLGPVKVGIRVCVIEIDVRCLPLELISWSPS
jgi:hypothetical protein